MLRLTERSKCRKRVTPRRERAVNRNRFKKSLNGFTANSSKVGDYRESGVRPKQRWPTPSTRGGPVWPHKEPGPPSDKWGTAFPKALCRQGCVRPASQLRKEPVPSRRLECSLLGLPLPSVSGPGQEAGPNPLCMLSQLGSPPFWPGNSQGGLSPGTVWKNHQWYFCGNSDLWGGDSGETLRGR